MIVFSRTNIVVGSVVVALSLTILGFQMRGGSKLTRTGMALERAEPAEDPLANRSFELSGHKNDFGELSDSYLAFAAHDEMVDERVISVSATVSLKSLAEKGEALPSADMAEPFVHSRAPRVAEAECAIIERMLASSCAVRTVHGELTAKGRYVKVRMRLNFVPRSERGDLPEGRVHFTALDEGLDKKESGTKTTIGSAPKLRARYYRKAAARCEKLRRKQRNCSLTGLHIGQGYNGTRGYAQRATATYGVLTPL